MQDALGIDNYNIHRTAGFCLAPRHAMCPAIYLRIQVLSKKIARDLIIHGVHLNFDSVLDKRRRVTCDERFDSDQISASSVQSSSRVSRPLTLRDWHVTAYLLK